MSDTLDNFEEEKKYEYYASEDEGDSLRERIVAVRRRMALTQINKVSLEEQLKTLQRTDLSSPSLSSDEIGQSKLERMQTECVENEKELQR